MDPKGVKDPKSEGGRYCFECHRSVAHGQRGISILPYQDKGLYDASHLFNRGE